LERAVPHLFVALPRGPHAACALDIVAVQPQDESMHWADQVAGSPWSERETTLPWIGQMSQLVPWLSFWEKMEMGPWAVRPPPLAAFSA